MKKADIFVNEIKAGQLIENSIYDYEFKYDAEYNGLPVSLTLPTSQREYHFTSFPAFFEGLLPEGMQLEALLKDKKINRSDLFGQLMACGADCVGVVTIREVL